MREPDGYLALVLHAHLPFVRHPEFNDPMEEYWLYEAITETYIPLLNVFNKLMEDGVDFRITMSLTPPLIAMLKATSAEATATSRARAPVPSAAARVRSPRPAAA